MGDVILAGLLQLLVQAGHHLPGRAYEDGLISILGFGNVGEVHVAVVFLVFLGLLKIQVGFPGKFLSDAVGAKVDAAREKVAVLEEDHIARLGPNVQ